MISTELRIGNLVSIYSGGNPKLPMYSVTKKVLSVGIFECEVINSDEIPACVEKWDKLENNMISPIPITKDNLDKFFGKQRDQYNYDYGLIDVRFYESGKMAVEIPDGGRECWGEELDIKYIHQLQNLYFAIYLKEINTVSLPDGIKNPDQSKHK